MPDNTFYLPCSCSALNHVVRFTRFEDENELYVEVVLDPSARFFTRLRAAFVYLFQRSPCRFSAVAEVVVKPEDLPRLKAWIDGGIK